MNVEEVLNKIEKLPPAPAVLPKLLKLLSDMDSDPEDIVRLIKVDPALTAQVLKLSNSAYFGGGQSHDLDDAIGKLGFREVYKLVGMVCGKDALGGSLDALYIQEGQLWEYSLATGFVMEMLAQRQKADATSAYTIGLLHSLGKVVLATYKDFNYLSVLEKIETEKVPMDQAERALYGLTNPEIGAALLRKWKFEESILIPIEYQAHPVDAPEPYKLDACMLNIAIWTVASLGLLHGKNAWSFSASPEAAEHIGISDQEMQRFVVSTHDRLGEIKELLEQSQN
jgi:HD-like signal output (HDOD) protein